MSDIKQNPASYVNPDGSVNKQWTVAALVIALVLVFFVGKRLAWW